MTQIIDKNQKFHKVSWFFEANQCVEWNSIY